MRREISVITVLLLLFSSAVSGQSDSLYYQQRDIIDYAQKFFAPKYKDTTNKRKNRNLAFSLLPYPSASGGDNGLVISFVTTFYASKDREHTKMSEVYFAPYFTFTGQYVFPIQTYIYSKNNVYNFIGDYRFLIYPQNTYGLGNNNTVDEMSRLHYQQWRFYQFVNRKVVGDFRMGVGFLYDNYKNITEESYIEDQTDYVKYMKGDFSDVSSFGIALQALFDSRHNIINPTQGAYLELDYRVNADGGVDNQSWQSVYLDTRKYFSLSSLRHKVLALRGFYWSTIGGDSHYLDLPSIGWDRYGKTGRGFTRNRFRSNALLFFETEYRTDITKNGFLGAVFYANATSVSQLYTQNFTTWHPGVGTGLRVKWNKKNNNNLTVDLGLSKNDWSFRVGLAENF